MCKGECRAQSEKDIQLNAEVQSKSVFMLKQILMVVFILTSGSWISPVMEI